MAAGAIRGVQDLIRVRVANTAQEVWIGQRTFQCVVLAREDVAKLFDGGVERLEPAGIQRRERGASTHQLQ